MVFIRVKVAPGVVLRCTTLSCSIASSTLINTCQYHPHFQETNVVTPVILNFPNQVLLDAHGIVSKDKADAPYKIPPFTAESSQSFDTWWLSRWASATEDIGETIAARLAPPTGKKNNKAKHATLVSEDEGTTQVAKKKKKSTPTPVSQDDVVAFHNSTYPATVAINQATTSNKVTKSKEVAVESSKKK
ncbi:protein DA1-like isoform 1 [Corchorus olitorius]|uniref:Protein DA1-like isoform 1 n=1 Tax=Corchorus olitorius TaxID=93759 RepID=A0A1R3G9R5_9ROSI|nr:protein DA1-like isoform 1 [Corchorus olitorius]